MNIRAGILILFLSLPALYPALSQENEARSSTELLWQYFDNVYGNDERLVTGHFYHGPARGPIKGHPYYLGEAWKNGIIETDDASFSKLQLKYDICLNKMILRFTSTDNAVYQIGLNSGKIKSVRMSGREFIPLPGASDSTGIPFAEVVSDGHVQYLVTRAKTLEIASSPGSSDYEYKEYLRQYLYKGDDLIPFRSKITLYRLYPELKGDLRRYVRKNYLYLIRNRIDDRKILIDYCNSLLNYND